MLFYDIRFPHSKIYKHFSITYFFSYFSARSLEPLTGVLDALSSAWQTWGDDDSLSGAPLGNQWQSDVRHRQSADKPFIFSQ